VDTVSATDVHPRCPRKHITAKSASARDLLGYGPRELLPHQANQVLFVLISRAFFTPSGLRMEGNLVNPQFHPNLL
jgi:hypothetical protein